MTTEDLLLIWEPDEHGEFVPLSYSFVLGRIEAFQPDDDCAALFRRLRDSGWIEILPNGEWTLTKQGRDARPKSSSRVTVAKSESNADREAAWRKFRRLCDYYADCVLQQEVEAEYLFDNQFNTRFLLPSLPFGWTRTDTPFPISVTQEQSVSDLEALNPEFDAFICGSDQIWAPSSYNPHYFLDYVREPEKMIAYAPSIGLPQISDENVSNRIKYFTSRFTHISTRERQGSEIIGKLLGRTVETVVDPTLLLSKEDFRLPVVL